MAFGEWGGYGPWILELRYAEIGWPPVVLPVPAAVDVVKSG